MSYIQDYANNVSDILRHKGEALGSATANKGQIWGGTIANLGQVIPQQVQDVLRQRAEQRKQAQIQQIFQETNGDLEQAIPRVMGIDQELGSRLLKQHAEIKRDALEWQKLDWERKKLEIEVADRMLGSITDEDSYARYVIAQKQAGRDVSKLPPQYDPAWVKQQKIASLSIKDQLELENPNKKLERIETTDAEGNPVTQFVEPNAGAFYPKPKTKEPVKTAQITTVGADGKPVTKFVEEIPGAEYPQVPASQTDRNPTEASLALAAANGDKTAARALALIRAQRVGSGGGDTEDVNGLVATVLENPALWDQLTPTVRGKIAPELRSRGYTNFGKPLSEAAMKQIAESQSAIDSLTDLRSVLKENEQYLGPVAGLAALNPYSDARKAQAKIDLVRQRVGKALEGGVLRKEDEEKYKKILATLRDTPDTAIYKVDGLIKNIQNNIDQFKAAQRLGGRNLDLSGSTPKPNTPTVGSLVIWQGKRYRVKAIVNGQAELEER